MAHVVGDIKEIVCQHTLGEFRFWAKANESFTLIPGGLMNNDDANQVTSNGISINQKNRSRWSIEGPISVDFNAEDTLSILMNLSEHPDEGVWTFSHVSGAIWKGTGTIVGEISADTNTGQLTLKVSGGGKLEKIN